MTLAAFTNEIGYHSRSSVLTGRYSGQYFRVSYDGEISVSFGSIREFSRKPPPFKEHGTFRSNFYYYRNVGKVVSEQPYIVRRYNNDPDPLTGLRPVIDLSEERFISEHAEPFGFVPAGGVWSDNAYAASITRALERLGEAKASIGATIGEGREAVDMLCGAVIKGGNFLLALKRRDFRNIPKILGLDAYKKGKLPQSVGDAWLAWSFGWKPLANEIYALHQIVQQKVQAINIEGKATENWSDSGQVTYGTHSRTTIKWTAKGSHRTILGGTVGNNYLHVLSRTGLINPASIAWELVPWSFAIDWFAPIGTYLDALTAGAGLSDEGGYTSSHVNTEVSLSMETEVPENPENYRVISSSGSRVERFFSFDRTPYTRWPRARVFVDTTWFSLPRAANALALMRQLV